MQMYTAEEIKRLQDDATKGKVAEQLQIIKNKIDEHLENGNLENFIKVKLLLAPKTVQILQEKYNLDVDQRICDHWNNEELVTITW